MSKKQKNVLKSLVMICSKAYNRLCSFFKPKKIREKYLNDKDHKSELAINGFFEETKLVSKLISVFKTFINVCITGWLIHYSLTEFNFISLGIATYLGQYYIGWLIDKIKQKPRDANGTTGIELIQ